MEATIQVEGYQLHCIIGSHAYEREMTQELALDIQMLVNITECTRSDAIVDTVNYAEVVEVCRELAHRRRYHLLETFAFEAAHALMDAFSPIKVKVKVKKPKAIPLARAASVEVELSK